MCKINTDIYANAYTSVRILYYNMNIKNLSIHIDEVMPDKLPVAADF